MTQERNEALKAIQEAACEITGFAPDAVAPRTPATILERELERGDSEADIASAARRRDPGLAGRIIEAVAVSETYFFRHAEQFDAVVAHLQHLLGVDSLRFLRAWSAGCASGEEAWSLAACLDAIATSGWEVTGTDLLISNISKAASGLYGAWSVRQRAQPWPAWVDEGAGRYRVRNHLRASTRFRTENLLSRSASNGMFDVIFCRNVLVYFSPEARDIAIQSLAESLAPDGILVFGSMDTDRCPPGLVRFGPVELQMFAKADAVSEIPLEPEPAPSPSASPVKIAEPIRSVTPIPIVLSPIAIERHLGALALVETGDERRAAIVLDELIHAAPDYIPALVERALLHQRHAAPAAARALMERVLAIVGSLPPDAPIPGPEQLPARFYAGSARSLLAFLSGRDE